MISESFYYDFIPVLIDLQNKYLKYSRILKIQIGITKKKENHSVHITINYHYCLSGTYI